MADSRQRSNSPSDSGRLPIPGNPVEGAPHRIQRGTHHRRPTFQKNDGRRSRARGAGAGPHQASRAVRQLVALRRRATHVNSVGRASKRLPAGEIARSRCDAVLSMPIASLAINSPARLVCFSMSHSALSRSTRGPSPVTLLATTPPVATITTTATAVLLLDPGRRFFASVLFPPDTLL